MSLVMHEDMISSAILLCLRDDGFMNLAIKSISELDLLDQKKVYKLFVSEKPVYVFLTLVMTGGILANSQYPAEIWGKADRARSALYPI